MIDRSPTPSPDDGPKEQKLYPSTLYIFRIAHLSDEIGKGSGDDQWYEATRQLQSIISSSRRDLVNRVYDPQRSVASDDKSYTEPNLQHSFTKAIRGALHVLASEPVRDPERVYAVLKEIYSIYPGAGEPITKAFLETPSRDYRRTLIQAASVIGQTFELDLLGRALPEFQVKGTNYGRTLLEVKDLLRDVQILDSLNHPYRYDVGQLLQPAVKRLTQIDRGEALPTFVDSVLKNNNSITFTLEQLLTPLLDQVRYGAIAPAPLLKLLHLTPVSEWVNGQHLQLLGPPMSVRREMVSGLFGMMRDAPQLPSGELHPSYFAATKLLGWLGQWNQHTAATYLSKQDLYEAKQRDEFNGLGKDGKLLWPNLLVIALGSKRHGHLAIGGMVEELSSSRTHWNPIIEPLMLHATQNHLEGVLLHCVSGRNADKALRAVFEILKKDAAQSETSRTLITRLKLLADEDKLHTLFPPNQLKSSWKMTLKSGIALL